MKFEKEIWYTIEKDGAPPFDTLVLVTGEKECIDFEGMSYGFNTLYAIAYNNSYRPEMCMIQVLELSDEDKKNLNKIYVEVPFDIKKWMII